jgi:hypothetical protein
VPGRCLGIRKGIGAWICWKYYVLRYENGKMRYFETILRMVRGRIKENDGRGEFNEIHCKHFCKMSQYTPSTPIIW